MQNLERILEVRFGCLAHHFDVALDFRTAPAYIVVSQAYIGK